ncbi:MAG: sulfotransferase family protein [Caulobacterales bacterium]|uniref:sulfotransferase family protein n=1 Tax=Glycocaulis sp. TaxID=1969725 RepID=UPI003F9EF79F
MTKIDLVFRRIDERTADVALELAKRHIRPDAIHIMDDVRPFTRCVEEMLKIEHDCDYVVYLDADCLILEDMRAFIEECDAAYVDAYVSDRFRGRIHCGVHITRIDLVRAMARVTPPVNDLKYALRPESRLRNIAMKPLRLSKQFRNFDILHDHFQAYRHIFQKYALRELRSRTDVQFRRLSSAMSRWNADADADMDFKVAAAAVAYARRHVPADASAAEVHAFISALPEHAQIGLAEIGIAEKGDFTLQDLEAWLERNDHREVYGSGSDRPKVFGLGLSRTGTRSLTSALQMLGWDCSHYPIDEDTYTELANGQYDLTLLKHHDGLTDITCAPYYQQFDKQYPGSKFVLTVRDKDPWLNSCRNHWFNRPAFGETDDPDEEVHFLMRQLLRAAVYGCYTYVPGRFSWVYDRHVAEVKAYFKDRPEDLLVIDVCAGEGFEKLAPFLGVPVPAEPFPHKGSLLTRRVEEARAGAVAAE